MIDVLIGFERISANAANLGDDPAYPVRHGGKGRAAALATIAYARLHLMASWSNDR
jgi:hypothetical protein